MDMSWKRHSAAVTRSRRWKALRAVILRRDRYRCRSCGAAGRLEVDHVKPVRTHPDLAWSPHNLQALCGACHARKTRLECGHDPQHPDRERWRAAVLDLSRAGWNRPQTLMSASAKPMKPPHGARAERKDDA